MKKFNLNDYIKVKLTDYGKDIYFQRFDTMEYPLLKGQIKPCDENGFTEFQMWDFINLYGHYIYLGAENVIEDIEIYIDEKYLKE